MSKDNQEWKEGADIGTGTRIRVAYPNTAVVPYFQRRGGFSIYEDFESIPEDEDIAFTRHLPVGRPAKYIPATAQRVALKLTHGTQSTATFPRGLNIIYAGTGVGKSLLMSELAKRSKRIMHLKATEPHDDESEIGKRLHFAEADDALVYGMAMWARDRSLVPVIDSLRGPLFETSGSAGDKGVIMSFFTMLTKVSTALANQGCTMFATLNPMSENVDQQKVVETYLKASVPSVIQLDSIVDNVFQGRFTMRDKANYRNLTPFVMPATNLDKDLPDLEISHLISVPSQEPETMTEMDSLLVNAIK